MDLPPPLDTIPSPFLFFPAVAAEHTLLNEDDDGRCRLPPSLLLFFVVAIHSNRNGLDRDLTHSSIEKETNNGAKERRKRRDSLSLPFYFFSFFHCVHLNCIWHSMDV